MQNISPSQAIELCKGGAIFLDIREEFETAARRFLIDTTFFLPNSCLKDEYAKLPRNKTIIVADSVGIRSKEAAAFLENRGFENVMNLAGGIVDWERTGNKVITNPKDMLHGQCVCTLKSQSGLKSDFK
jgi:rhodanese-related sulfurtransferase